MANASMDIKTTLEVVPTLPVETSVIIRADHGVGKSRLARRLSKIRCNNDGIARTFIDRRLSQMTDGDLLGLPSIEGKSTSFNPPDWYVQACESPCTLFLDEFNRATGEVMQAAFQIVLDRELAGRALHPDTLVYSAINVSGQYTVNEMDPALLDRFFVIDLNPSVEDWLMWGAEKDPENLKKKGRQNIETVVIDFIRTNDIWLDPPKDKAEPSDVSPSRRSWEFVNDALVGSKMIDEPDNTAFLNTCIGFLGYECANKFRSYVKTLDRQISGEDVLERFTAKKVQSKLKVGDLGVTHDVWNDLIEKLAGHIFGNNVNTFTKKQGENIKAFAQALPDELRIKLWAELTSKGIENVELAKSVHQYMGKSIIEIFGVKPGPAGVGMTPTIPSMFKNDKNE